MKSLIKQEGRLLFLGLLILQTAFFLLAGANKTYLHMDEAYSLGLAQYDRVEIIENEDFYDTWHTGEYYEAYLSVGEDQPFSLTPVYENQKNDVHPPLYYLLLRIAMGFHQGSFSFWPGICLNILIYIGITGCMYLLLKQILPQGEHQATKAMIFAFLSSITIASVSGVVYIRMYALASLWVVLCAYLHIRLAAYKGERPPYRLLTETALCTLAGLLTHYHFLFFFGTSFLLFFFHGVHTKKRKLLLAYLGFVVAAVCVAVAIFPYMIVHLFFGYRGQGALEALLNQTLLFHSVGNFLMKLQTYAFHKLLFPLLLGMAALLLYRRSRKPKTPIQSSPYEKYLIVPAVVFFVFVAITAPYVELRYILPICGVLFAWLLCKVDALLHSIFSQKCATCILCIFFAIFFCLPPITIPFHDSVEVSAALEPETLYTFRSQIVQEISDRKDVPAIYLYKSEEGRFLDDILLFSRLEASYVAKNPPYTEAAMNRVLRDRPTTDRLLVFINEGQDREAYLELLKQASGLRSVKELPKLNACYVYYLTEGENLS